VAVPPKSVQPHQGQQLQQIEHHVRKIHQGPLPAPEDLQRYNDLLPGAAERIIKMAEAEQMHRHEQESRAMGAEVVVRETFQVTERERIAGVMSSDKRGQYLGAAVSVLAIVGAIYLAKDQPIVAGALLGLPVLGIVKALRNGTTQHPTDKQAKKPSE